MSKAVKIPGQMSKHPFNVTPRPVKGRRNSWWRKYKNTEKEK